MTRIVRALANGWVVTLVFTVITIAATWPLVTVMNTKIASDVGDPVFNSWVMMWTGGQVLRFLSGDFHALADYWNGNIFYPERLTIAYSEHLTPQMLQILPVFAVTHNIVLCYNLLFVSAIVLSAVGMYLFVRELTGQPIAGVVAGAAFAFSPYRADQYAHLQVVSSQWMPIALYGFQRYFAAGRVRALAGATAALVVQALSCGYYLFFFTPFAALFAVLEGARRGAWRRRQTWRQIAVAATLSLLVIAAFAWPYFALRASNSGVGVRRDNEVRVFSADTWAFATASENLAVWGGLQTFPRPEGSGFPGATILVIGLAGATVVVRSAMRRSRDAPSLRSRWGARMSAVLTVLLTLCGVLLAAGWTALLIWHRLVIREPWLRVTVRQFGDIGWKTLIVIAAALALVPRLRRAVVLIAGSIGGFLLVSWLASLVLSLGPQVFVAGNPIGTGPYKWLAEILPGFNALRVPSRYFMVASLFLGALGGIGVAAMLQRYRRAGPAAAAALFIAILVEGRTSPFNVSKPLEMPQYNLTATDLPTPANWGAVYDAVVRLPANAVLAEFPFGSNAFEVRTMYFAGYHRRPVINGFSGFFPETYYLRRTWLENYPPEKPEAWRRLLEAGVTHVIVHEQPFLGARGPLLSEWIRKSGGREIAAAGTDRLFAIR
jgi:hypothetical protein